MAKKKKAVDPPKGSPAWMATFSDLMNLLLCFFVLLFSMSSVDAEKFEMVIASLQSSFSILPAGGSSIGDGQLISSGISQLENFDVFFNLSSGTSVEENETDTEDTELETELGTSTPSKPEEMSQEDLEEAYEKQALSESEIMAEKMESQLATYGIQDQVEVDFNAQYVRLTLNGAVLFASGQSDIRTEAVPLVTQIGKILEVYTTNIIDVEGHTDNVPISTSRYADNNVLSMYRALTVADYIRSITSLNPSYIKSSGRGDYVPVADNSTEEGRARNRRVEIKIYNSYNSDMSE